MPANPDDETALERTALISALELLSALGYEDSIYTVLEEANISETERQQIADYIMGR